VSSVREQPLPGMPIDPMQHGLYPIVMDASGDAIDHGKWLRACAEGKLVGTCRWCGHYLKPEAPAEMAGRFDYEATCVNDFRSGVDPETGYWVAGCGKTVVMPGGRVFRKSTRDRERPNRD
jgi:hypothetical protein